MLRINLHIIALVLWLSFLFNLERLHFRKVELIDIDRSVYLLLFLLALLGLLLPQWKRFSRLSLQVFGVIAFIIAKFVFGGPDPETQAAFVTLFQLGAVLVTITLSSQVGELSADFIQTVRGIVLSEQRAPIYTTEQVEPILKREMQLSRRRNRPLTVLVLEPESESAQFTLSATAQEIQKLLAKRYSLLSLGRQLTQFLRSSDIILEQTEPGRLVLIMPEMTGQQGRALLRRLDGELQQDLSISSRYGMASFPEEGLTLEELIYRAEKNIGQDIQTRSDGSDSREATVRADERVWDGKAS